MVSVLFTVDPTGAGGANAELQKIIDAAANVPNANMAVNSTGTPGVLAYTVLYSIQP